MCTQPLHLILFWGETLPKLFSHVGQYRLQTPQTEELFNWFIILFVMKIVGRKKERPTFTKSFLVFS